MLGLLRRRVLKAKEARLRLLLSDLAKLEVRKSTGDGLDIWAEVFWTAHSNERDSILAEYPELRQRVAKDRAADDPGEPKKEPT